MGLSHPLAAVVASTGLSHGLEALAAVGLVAALAPLVVAVLPGPRMPQVVVFLLGGILIGPHVLGLSDTYSIELLAPGTGDMYGMTVLEVDPTFRLLSRLDARVAHVTAEGWEMTDGAFREFGPKGEVSTIPFMMTALDMQEDLDDFTKIQKPIAAMSYWELKDYIGRLQATGFQVKKYLVELYSKLSFPLVNMIMVLVAIPFSLQSPRGGRLFGVGLAIAIMAGYLVVHYIALAFARADLLPPLLAAWTANIIFLGLGTSLFLRART